VAAPLTLSGDSRWTDYTVSAKVLIDHTGTASLLGRVVNQLNNVGTGRVNAWQGYYLKLADSGTWSLQVLDPDKTTRVLASGSLSSAGADTWHRVSLGFSGETITARIDGTEVAQVSDATYDHGQVGLGLDSYTTSQFDDLTVLPAHNAQRAPGS
jgi:hypothetical protein